MQLVATKTKESKFQPDWAYVTFENDQHLYIFFKIFKKREVLIVEVIVDPGKDASEWFVHTRIHNDLYLLDDRNSGRMQLAASNGVLFMIAEEFS